ncbi:MAG: GNAT family N-acetyltransferase [Candidatus Pacearchaeota archaeon]|nr:GNAT family N-acetyltransferase [Candidatus Pacearchaeota archaeon]
MSDKDPKELKAISLLKRNLRVRFSLFDEGHQVDARAFDNGELWVGYSAGGFDEEGRHGGTYFDLNLRENVCYLLHIELQKKFRGRGFGWRLYQAVQEFARSMGSRVVRQFPSGGFFAGEELKESRRDYLVRRGYGLVGDNPDGEVELVL